MSQVWIENVPGAVFEQTIIVEVPSSLRFVLRVVGTVELHPPTLLHDLVPG